MRALYLLVLYLLAPICLICQTGEHEKSLAYGYLSTNGGKILQGSFEPLFTLFTLGLFNVEVKNVKETGPFVICWKYIPNERMGYGLSASYLKGSYDEVIGSIFSSGKTIIYNQHSAFTFAGEVDYRYIREEKFTLYSVAALGYSFLKTTISNETNRDNQVDFQISPIGLRYGKELGVFVEFGIGFKGLILIGLNVR